MGSIPGQGRSPGEGIGNPLQYSCLENPMEGGAWWATVHGVAKSQTRLRDSLTHSLTHSINTDEYILNKLYQIKPSYITSVNLKCGIHFGKQFVGLQNVKYRVTTCHNNSTPRYLPKRNKTKHVSTQKCVHRCLQHH